MVWNRISGLSQPRGAVQRCYCVADALDDIKGLTPHPSRVNGDFASGDNPVAFYVPLLEYPRLWALAKLEPQPEPQSLGLIKEKIGGRYGMLDLLDVFVEADRLVDFTRFFTHSGTREVRSRDALRPLLILDLFVIDPGSVWRGDQHGH
jgi:hypothetical protein